MRSAIAWGRNAATGATFGNGNSAGVAREVDDDLSALEYALKDEAGAAQALKWEYIPGFGLSGSPEDRLYTNAHRLQSQTVSVPAHDWSPPANVTTTYTAPSLSGEAANKVDQYEAIAESRCADRFSRFLIGVARERIVRRNFREGGTPCAGRLD
ncbi:MAG: hypothetical protein U1E87_01050 [Alphaproteobacteria bacterium]